jgi:hypothetical protein
MFPGTPKPSAIDEALGKRSTNGAHCLGAFGRVSKLRDPFWVGVGLDAKVTSASRFKELRREIEIRDIKIADSGILYMRYIPRPRSMILS